MIKDTDNKTLRNFALGAGVLFSGISTYLFYKDGHYSVIMFITISTVFFLTGFLSPASLLPVYKVWMGLARVIGLLNTAVILFLVFFLLVTPIALILRILRKDILDINIDKNSPTYWSKREKTVLDVRSYERHY